MTPALAMAASSVPPPTPAGAKPNDINATTAAATAPLKDDFVAKFPAREALKEKNQKYWEEDPYSESCALAFELRFSGTLQGID